jgi:predicted nucleic acid-binding protein
MTTVVVDASIAARWLLPDEENDEADRVMETLGEMPGLVPSLFWHETRNLFLTAERRKRFRSGEAALAMAQLRALGLRDEGPGGDAEVLNLAARRALSVYDACYLALSLRRKAPLATADERLAQAARAEGVSVVGPLARAVRTDGERQTDS